MSGIHPHLKIGVDSSLNNKGSTFKIGHQVGLEIEQCQTLMKALKWTYEFVQYNNEIGHVLENGTATGMLGDIQKGRIDMACGRFRMTPDRAHILTFTYPTQFELFSAIWLLAWFHVFIDFYTSELSGMMVVSDKKQMPFEDFYGLIEQLRKGSYRLFTPFSDRIPECPREISPSKCISIFSEILSKHPPEYGDVTQLNDRDFVSSVCPAAYIVRPTFPYLDELNKMIIKILPAFSTIDNHYTPAYPQLSLIEKPSKSSFTLNQLSSIFVIHLLGTFISSLLLIIEIVMSEQRIPTILMFIFRKSNQSKDYEQHLCRHITRIEGENER
ncbi:hypothetical protein GCK72_006079 [Caenorhabditis remanei]|uniref:Uncharacterized protein n=1 Tax=Caenorhabditis remanei TaxID=31234 RepID=A0A6A5HIB4_CAERE|nr:hypothetical protein GCK72_006079 [Caenorhabditis remanei]KAF1766123.1 hypothetical protein GCK72_006079 [Caenorhabditis remanei]